MTKYIFAICFILTIIFDCLVKQNYLGAKVKAVYLRFVSLNHFSASIFLFISIWLIFNLFSFLNISLFTIINENNYIMDLYLYMSENSNTTPSTSNTTININIEQVNIYNFKTVNVDKKSGQKVAAAISSTGGMMAGIRFAQAIPGSPSIKLAAGGLTMATVQAFTLLVSKYLDTTNSNNGDNTKNFTVNLFKDSTYTTLENKFPDFPLNLLPEMNLLVNIELSILIVFFNIFIVNLLMKIDYKHYLPNNKIEI